MGLRSFFGLERREAPRSLTEEQVLAKLDGGLGDLALPAVTTNMAMQVATVMACVRVIADGCATPPLNVYREEAGGTRKLASNVPQFRLLNRRPNEWQTSLEFRRTMTMHAALTGNGLALKVKVGSRLAELIPIRPGFYRIDRVGRYDYRFPIWDEYGSLGTLSVDDVFHLPAWQWDGVAGLDAVRLAQAAVGLSAAAETNQAQLYANGGRPAGILTTDQPVSPEVVSRLRESWKAFSAQRRSGTAVLDNGFKYLPISMSGVDAQHLETRRFQVEEICRAFGVFPQMIGHSDKTSTYASAEAFFAAHLIHTLAPWHQLWVQRLDEFVLDGAGPLYCEFDTRYLRAGSMKDRAVWARTMAEMGIYSRNELRDEEGKDPLPGLDDPLTPLNMTGATGGDTGGTNEPQA